MRIDDELKQWQIDRHREMDRQRDRRIDTDTHKEKKETDGEK